MAATLTITPARALVDEPLSICLGGFPPRQPVHVSAQMTDDLGTIWRSEAVFMTDAQGQADLIKQSPQSGTYDSADPMGLIWSMKPDKPGALVVFTTLDPVRIAITASAGDLSASAEIERLRLSDGVTREVVRDQGLFGTLFTPPGPGPHPAIILLSGSNGGLSEQQAALYASRGIAALALAYFNYEALPKYLIEIPLEYFETAIGWLQTHPRIDGARLAVGGGSRGGELALLLGATFPQIRAVVANVPSGLAWGGFSPDPADASKPAWTYRGQPIPFMKGEAREEDRSYYEDYRERGEPIPATPGFLAMMSDPAIVQAAAIPVEKTNGAILMISGEEDAMWPSTRLAEIAVERLRAHNFAHPYRHVRYPGAGHAILPPYMPVVIALTHPVDGGLYALGGNPRDAAFACADYWKQARQFLSENL